MPSSNSNGTTGYDSLQTQQEEEERRPLASQSTSNQQWRVPVVSSFESYGENCGGILMVDNIPTKLRHWGLWTGILYCIIIICGFCAELGVRGRLVDYDDPRHTAKLIRENPGSIRQGLWFDVVMCTADICVSLLFSMILIVAGANPFLSIASSLFRFLQQAVIANNLLHMFAASLLLDESLHPALPVASVINSMSGSTDDVAGKWAFFFLYLHKYGYLLALYFFGLSMLFLGAVIVKYGVFPRWMGWAIGSAGFGYVMDTLLYFMAGEYTGQATTVLMLPALVAEFSLAGFLVLGTPKVAA